MPHLYVIRPADANETAIAWKIAIRDPKRPHALVLSRQNLPVLDRKRYGSVAGAEKGGYVLLDCKGTPDIILLSSGAEIHPTIAAAEELQKAGIKARVVNMFSFEIFEEQTAAYKNSVIPLKVEKRLAVEAAATQSWYRYTGLTGEVIGMDHFGASAPAKVLFEKFGFTKENITARAKKLLKK
jgi:transketolase